MLQSSLREHDHTQPPILKFVYEIESSMFSTPTLIRSYETINTHLFTYKDDILILQVNKTKSPIATDKGVMGEHSWCITLTYKLKYQSKCIIYKVKAILLLNLNSINYIKGIIGTMSNTSKVSCGKVTLPETIKSITNHSLIDKAVSPSVSIFSLHYL